MSGLAFGRAFSRWGAETMSWDQTWKGIVATVGTGLTWFFGGWDKAIAVLIAVITLDWITGVVAAFKEKRLDSEVGHWGLLRKVGILILVGLGNLVDLLVSADAPVIRTAVAYWYIGNEGISLAENFGRLGVPLPQWLMEALAQLKNRQPGGEAHGGQV